MAGDTATTWDDERVAELRRLWGEGHSASRIAQLLGFGSRNMVCGKLHRMGLSKSRLNVEQPAPVQRQVVPKPRPQPEPRIVQEPVPVVRRPIDPRTAPVPIVEPVSIGPTALVSLQELATGMCRWPVGDPMRPGFGFCGGGAREGGSYCERHAMLAYDSERNRQARRFRG